MNCWPSGKYVNLLYMYSILGRGSFCFNYCLNSAWHGGDQFVALLRWYGSPGFFDSGLQVICIFWSLVSHFPLDNFPQVWWVFKKHNGPTLADDIAPQIITDCGNLTLDFMQLGLWASPPFLQTLGPWFPNEIQNLLSSEKRTLDHWATVLLLLSPGKTLSVVQEWLNKRNTTTVAKFLDTSVCGGSWCLDPSLSPFLVKFTQILESILLDNPHKAAVLSVGCATFSSTLFPSTQLSVNMLGYSTLWTASFFGNECLWLTLLVKGVNYCLLDNCLISSLPHDCVA